MIRRIHKRVRVHGCVSRSFHRVEMPLMGQTKFLFYIIFSSFPVWYFTTYQLLLNDDYNLAAILIFWIKWAMSMLTHLIYSLATDSWQPHKLLKTINFLANPVWGISVHLLLLLLVNLSPSECGAIFLNSFSHMSSDGGVPSRWLTSFATLPGMTLKQQQTPTRRHSSRAPVVASHVTPTLYPYIPRPGHISTPHHRNPEKRYIVWPQESCSRIHRRSACVSCIFNGVSSLHHFCTQILLLLRRRPMYLPKLIHS